MTTGLEEEGIEKRIGEGSIAALMLLLLLVLAWRFFLEGMKSGKRRRRSRSGFKRMERGEGRRDRRERWPELLRERGEARRVFWALG